jgi:hypothetical protein
VTFAIILKMSELRGNALFACVTTLTALGFFQIGLDNGLMVGFGTALGDPIG